MTLDHRLLTEDGRNEIKEDMTKANMVVTTAAEVATDKSTSIIGDRANGETAFFQSVENKNALYDANKKFVNDPANTQARDTLLNPNASPEEVQQAEQQLHNYIAVEMGVKPTEVKLMLDASNKGFTSEETGDVYIATNQHDNMGDMANTVTNETSDAVDLQRDADVVKTENYKTNRDEYSENFGNLGQEYLNSAYETATGSSINDTNYNQVNANLQTHSPTIATNTQEFQTLDKGEGAHRQLKTQEITFIKEHATEYATQKNNGVVPTQDEIQAAEHELAQEAMRGTDVVWNVVLGEENTQAKEFLEEKVEGKTFTNSRGEQQEYLSTKNGDFYDTSRYANEAASTETDIYEVAQEQARDTLSNPELLQERIKDKVKEVANVDTAIQIVNGIAEDAKGKDVLDIAKERLVDTAIAVVDGGETAYGVTNTSNKTLDTIYGEGTSEAIKGTTAILAVGAVVGDGKKGEVGDSNKGIYDSKEIRNALESKDGTENVTSTTVPKQTPRQTVNSKENVEVITDSYGNKAVITTYNDPLTGEITKANIPYNTKGLPVFDDVSKYTTTIQKPDGWESMSVKNRVEFEKRAATRDLRDKIDNGQIYSSQFTEKQLSDIQKGKAQIDDYTWHHNADSNNMQLVPRVVHDETKHIGESSMSKGN